MDEPVLLRSSGCEVCILYVMVFEPCPKRSTVLSTKLMSSSIGSGLAIDICFHSSNIFETLMILKGALSSHVIFVRIYP